MLILGVYGPSGSGKTHLISVICNALAPQYRVAVIKHASHHNQLDVEGKDSDVYIKAGAGAAMVSGNGVSLLSFRNAFLLEDALQFFRHSGRWDLVLVEGFKDARIPFIKVGGGEDRDGTLVVHQDEEQTISFIKEKLEDFTPKRVELEVDGKRIPLSDFPQDLIANTMDGLVSSFKGGEGGDIRIMIRRQS